MCLVLSNRYCKTDLQCTTRLNKEKRHSSLWASSLLLITTDTPAAAVSVLFPFCSIWIAHIFLSPSFQTVSDCCQVLFGWGIFILHSINAHHIQAPQSFLMKPNIRDASTPLLLSVLKFQSYWLLNRHSAQQFTVILSNWDLWHWHVTHCLNGLVLVPLLIFWGHKLNTMNSDTQRKWG